MNKLTIIGNLTKDPEVRQTPNNITVCSFTVAVNRRSRSEQPETDYFRVSAWRQLGENCAKFLAKGKKVAVVGPVGARTYQASDGSTRVSLEVTAEDVEFLSARGEGNGNSQASAAGSIPQGMVAVDTDELPF